MSKLSSMLKSSGLKLPPQRKTPVWLGPCAEGWNGGITQSMISRWLTCRERFRVRQIEGIKPVDKFKKSMEYGNMWHTCEEALAANIDWKPKLIEFTKTLLEKYKMDREEISKWYEVCKIQFPVYVEHWKHHPDEKSRRPIFQEQVFDVPYELPSGRTVRLRGKWDGGDLVGVKKEAGVWANEHKTKGDVDIEALNQQLTWDLQTQFYLVAMKEAKNQFIRGEGQEWIKSIEHEFINHPLKGVRYNVVRRPLSGGKGSIVRHKGSKNKPEETHSEYYDRLQAIIVESPGDFFYRWKTEISPEQIKLFERETLKPLLEQICDWYEWVGKVGRTFDGTHGDVNRIHWRHPFGCENSVDSFGATEIDKYLDSGSMVGLEYTDTLFGELKS